MAIRIVSHLWPRMSYCAPSPDPWIADGDDHLTLAFESDRRVGIPIHHLYETINLTEINVMYAHNGTWCAVDEIIK